MIQTTFRKLHDAGACKERYRFLAKALGGIKAYGRDTPITLLQILDINGLDDALWALRACDDAEVFSRLLACDYAEHVLHIFEAQCPGDDRPHKAIEVARRYARGEAMEEALAAARAAAWDAAWAAAWDAARDAAWAAAWAAAGAAARDAAVAARDADLRGANLDFSCWPLWCGSKGVIVDLKVAYQLLAHVACLQCDDPEFVEIKKAIMPWAVKSHIAKNLGLTTTTEEEGRG